MTLFEKDLRAVDEIVLQTGAVFREPSTNEQTAMRRMLYILAVAVWHLLADKIRNGVKK